MAGKAQSRQTPRIGAWTDTLRDIIDPASDAYCNLPRCANCPLRAKLWGAEVMTWFIAIMALGGLIIKF